MSEILTEEDAKTKWCPFSRSVQFEKVEGDWVGFSANRLIRRGEVNPSTLCLASACMAWEWVFSGYAQMVFEPVRLSFTTTAIVIEATRRKLTELLADGWEIDPQPHATNHFMFMGVEFPQRLRKKTSESTGRCSLISKEPS